MPFTSKNDINIIQDSDSKTLNAQKGDDIYVLGPDKILKQHTLEISDSDGNNTLRLIDGIHIKSALLSKTTLKLTLDNDAVITVQNADKYFFDVGCDTFGRGGGIGKNYSDFVKDALGVTIPSTGSTKVFDKTIHNAINQTIEIGQETDFTGVDSSEIFQLDVEEALKSTGRKETLCTISNFDKENDSLKLNFSSDTITKYPDLKTLSDLKGVEFDADDMISINYDNIDMVTSINFGNDNSDQPVVIKLAGIAEDDWANIKIEVV